MSPAPSLYWKTERKKEKEGKQTLFIIFFTAWHFLLYPSLSL
jgi:hypothetical protein